MQTEDNFKFSVIPPPVWSQMEKKKWWRQLTYTKIERNWEMYLIIVSHSFIPSSYWKVQVYEQSDKGNLKNNKPKSNIITFSGCNVRL